MNINTYIPPNEVILDRYSSQSIGCNTNKKKSIASWIYPECILSLYSLYEAVANKMKDNEKLRDRHTEMRAHAITQIGYRHEEYKYRVVITLLLSQYIYNTVTHVIHCQNTQDEAIYIIQS